MAYYGEIIKGEEKVEYKVNSEKVNFSPKLYRELKYELNYNIEDISKYIGKDYFYIVIKVKIDEEKKV